MKWQLDSYTLGARVAPALLVGLPLVLSAVAWFPEEVLDWGGLWGLVTYCGFTVLLAQIVRDFGKRKEYNLFKSWGGAPAVRKLRHRHAENAVTLARYHENLSRLMPNLQIPDPEAEEKNPQAADEVYESCCLFLREKTRDHTKFQLLFQENINYGFRRNLWAMKAIGMSFSALASVAMAGAIYFNASQPASSTPPATYACGGINLFLLLCWLLCITRNWVKTAADAYAERLLGASDDL